MNAHSVCSNVSQIKNKHIESAPGCSGQGGRAGKAVKAKRGSIQ